MNLFAFVSLYRANVVKQGPRILFIYMGKEKKKRKKKSGRIGEVQRERIMQEHLRYHLRILISLSSCL